MKTISPSKEQMKLIQRLIDQNGEILKINNQVISSLMNPPIILDGTVLPETMKPGQISYK